MIYVPEHEYPSVNGPRTAPERWEGLYIVQSGRCAPDIKITILNARGSLARVKADITGTWQWWPEPSAAFVRRVLDPVLASVGRERMGRRIETGRWEWLYPTHEIGASK